MQSPERIDMFKFEQEGTSERFIMVGDFPKFKGSVIENLL